MYTAVLLVVLVGFSTALYLGQERQTLRQVERGLAVAVAAVSATRPERWQHGPPAPMPPRMRAQAAYLQTRDIQGRLVEMAAGMGSAELPLSDRALQAVLAGRSWSETTVVDGAPVLVHSAPIVRSGTVVGVVQAGGSLALLDPYLRGLRLSLVLVTGLAAAIAFLGGWFLAGEALRPIDRITRTARQIGAERDFRRRVDHTGPNDELGQLARTFNDMLGELESVYLDMAETLQTQRRFVADASHELRTPLTTIRGNAELLGLRPAIDAADHAAALADIVSETDRMIDLVGALLQLARSDAGHRPLTAPTPLSGLVEDVVRQARLLAPERSLHHQLEPGLAALAHRDSVRQILLNLLENAFRHTPPGTEVRLTALADGDQVVLTVADDGPGIDPALLPHVFERFQRGHPSRTGPGSGLGLSIARALAEAQDGAVDIQSAFGAGTVVTVRLPRARPEPPAP